jgi:hypothetical protein
MAIGSTQEMLASVAAAQARGEAPEYLYVKPGMVPGERGMSCRDIACAICLAIVANACWDGIKWSVTSFPHTCSSPPPPPPQPKTCPLCHEQIFPGKPHHCK